MELGLRRKAVLVTGASRGIGLATAAAFAHEWARVCLCAMGQAGLRVAVEGLRAAGCEAVPAIADVSSRVGAESAVQAALEAFGTLDVLVNNVGGSGGAGSFEHATAEQWGAVVDSNLLASVWCSQPAVALMRAHGGGAIVNISSIFGREYATSAPYSAAKAALIALTKEMAVDLAKYGIRVNSVAPGSVFFPGGSWERRQQNDPALIDKMKREALPWGRFGTPEEIAAVVVFLCSTRASWVSGACVPVDGAQGRAF